MYLKRQRAGSSTQKRRIQGAWLPQRFSHCRPGRAGNAAPGQNTRHSVRYIIRYILWQRRTDSVRCPDAQRSARHRCAMPPYSANSIPQPLPFRRHKPGCHCQKNDVFYPKGFQSPQAWRQPPPARPCRSPVRLTATPHKSGARPLDRDACRICAVLLYFSIGMAAGQPSPGRDRFSARPGTRPPLSAALPSGR